MPSTKQYKVHKVKSKYYFFLEVKKVFNIECDVMSDDAFFVLGRSYVLFAS